MDLLDAGINIVQLTPETVFRHEKSDMFDIMRAVMELSRGHGESARKSERNGAAWREKLTAARENGELLTGRLPGWREVEEGKPVLIPHRAAVVKEIFRMAATGHGVAMIVKKLTRDKVPAWGRSGVWSRAYVGLILKDRRAVGEHQPKGKGRKPDGE